MPGRVRDLTQGPITRTLLLFALPTLGQNVLQSLNGSINAVWIGRSLGEGALAATSNANLVMMLLISLGFGFGLAVSIMIGHRVGARDIVGARRAFGTGMGLFAILSVLIALLGWFASPGLLRILATPPAVQPLALAYLRVIFIAMPPMMLGPLLGMGQRGTGDAVTPLIFVGMGAVVDTLLNPVLIRGLGPAPQMGIAGSATATLISAWAVFLSNLTYVYVRDLPIRLRGPELKFLIPSPALLRLIVGKGLPMAMQMIMMSLSGLFMIGLVNRHGVEVTAAYGVTQQLWGYVQMPALAIGTGVSAMAAQNIGAGRWDRIDRITRAGVGINLLLTGAVVLLLFVSDRPLLALFLGGGSPAIPIAHRIQLIGSWSFILFGVTIVLFSTIRANGGVIAPLLILTAGVLVGRIAFAAIMLPHGEDWLWWSFPMGSSVTLILGYLYYRAGTWRRGSMLAGHEAVTETETTQEPGGRLMPSEGGAQWIG